jgi:hypothetical protein
MSQPFPVLSSLKEARPGMKRKNLKLATAIPD